MPALQKGKVQLRYTQSLNQYPALLLPIISVSLCKISIFNVIPFQIHTLRACFSFQTSCTYYRRLGLQEVRLSGMKQDYELIKGYGTKLSGELIIYFLNERF